MRELLPVYSSPNIKTFTSGSDVYSDIFKSKIYIYIFIVLSVESSINQILFFPFLYFIGHQVNSVANFVFRVGPVFTVVFEVSK